ncbi:cytochrome P450 9e2-like [Oppia nitens]|uniref:cytochrome P450 9e2-like n=1 Tax=Oppia nitens TaxID=1686743 RepID=UPI0023DA8A39|nr:cytochrome P450 9e2-like [Oppia nitens]
MYELAMNPAVQDRLLDELVRAFGRIDGRTGSTGAENYPTYDQLSKLPYLDAVVSETLRMYPPVTTTDRKLVSNTGYRLGQTGITLSPGQVVSIPIYAIHHCDRFYPNAGQFKPDRWLLPDPMMIPYTYLPFGAGPRNCIGMRFALMEIKLSLAQLVRGFQFSRTPQTAVPLEFRKVVRLCSAKEIMVGIEERH